MDVEREGGRVSAGRGGMEGDGEEWAVWGVEMVEAGSRGCGAKLVHY